MSDSTIVTLEEGVNAVTWNRRQLQRAILDEARQDRLSGGEVKLLMDALEENNKRLIEAWNKFCGERNK